MIEEKPKNRKPVNIVGILNVKKPAVPPKGFTQYQLWPDPKKRKANKSKAKTRRN